MPKKRRTSVPQIAETSVAQPQSLATYLADIRSIRRMTLRAVEDATNGAVSNAYLSQLENNKISQPSPNILNALAKAYSVPYETLMEKAGYPSPVTEMADVLRSGKLRAQGQTSVFAHEKLTPEEEAMMLEYLAFLRSRKAQDQGERRLAVDLGV